MPGIAGLPVVFGTQPASPPALAASLLDQDFQYCAVPEQTAATPFSYRNRLLNGDMRIDQRNVGAAQTITAGGSGVYTVDRWYAACTGANVTGQRVAGTGPHQYFYQFTGAASVTGISFGQRLEATDVYHMNGAPVMLSVFLANSLLTTVGWALYYPTATDNWAARTLITSGSFTVTSTPSLYTLPAVVTLPSNVTAGLELELTVGAQTSGTWTIGRAMLEPMPSGVIVASPFERVDIVSELARCQRYFEKSYPQGTAVGASGATLLDLEGICFNASDLYDGPTKAQFKVVKRNTSYTITLYNPSTGATGSFWDYNAVAAIGAATQAYTLSDTGFGIKSSTATLTAGHVVGVHWTASAEL